MKMIYVKIGLNQDTLVIDYYHPAVHTIPPCWSCPCTFPNFNTVDVYGYYRIDGIDGNDDPKYHCVVG